MRVVVTGATGNVGSAVLAALGRDPAVESIVGIARRLPAVRLPKTSWKAADVAADELVPIFRGADAVVHLAWQIQPSRDVAAMRRTNVLGSARVFLAAADAGVARLVYASSLGAYSAGPKDRPVDESWPTDGIATSAYSRHKAEVERILDGHERATRVVRLRKGLVFQRAAATEIRRLFLGPFFPGTVLRPGVVRVVPMLPRLRIQAVHADDVGEAYRLAVVGSALGAFNIASEPVVDCREIARLFGARTVPVPERMARAVTAATWRLRLQPCDPGWLDLALQCPLLDTARARRELGWTPRKSSREALRELVEGIRDGEGAATPPLSPASSGPLRWNEVVSGVGGWDGGSIAERHGR